MKYISTFQNSTLYNSVKNSLKTPHISHLVEDNESNIIQFNSINNVDYVEIAGIKWATKNLGANSITDYGVYFQWADSQGYTMEDNHSFNSYLYFNMDYINGEDDPKNALSKYSPNDGMTLLDVDDDAARKILGGSWHIPTKEDYVSLITNTTQSYVENYNDSGVNGALFIDNEDNSNTLFFPCAGGIIYTGESNVLMKENELIAYWVNELMPISNNSGGVISGSSGEINESNNIIITDENNPYGYYSYIMVGQADENDITKIQMHITQVERFYAFTIRAVIDF